MKYYNTYIECLDELEKIIKSGEDEDWWFGINRNDNAIGADFNYYKDHGKVSCAIYSAWPTKKGSNTYSLTTYTEDFEHYELDASDPQWKEKLIQTMIDFCSRRLKED